MSNTILKSFLIKKIISWNKITFGILKKIRDKYHVNKSFLILKTYVICYMLFKNKF